MIDGAQPYQTLHGLAVSGRLVVIVPGTIDGRPGCAWIAASLDARSLGVATARDDEVRVGQMVGAMIAMRAHYQRYGFTPSS